MRANWIQSHLELYSCEQNFLLSILTYIYLYVYVYIYIFNIYTKELEKTYIQYSFKIFELLILKC